jgi:adenylate kinase family enzyme
MSYVTHMSSLGKRIVVVGVSAAGKSTFARTLAAKLHLPLIHIDTIMWQPGWEYVGDEKTVQKLDEASSQPEWVIEGHIAKGARQFLFDRADTILYLDYSPIVAARRYIQRWLRHRKDPRPELEGSPEKFSFKFLKLVWTKGETTSLDKILEKPQFQDKIHRLTSPVRTKIFLRSIEQGN